MPHRRHHALRALKRAIDRRAAVLGHDVERELGELGAEPERRLTDAEKEAADAEATEAVLELEELELEQVRRALERFAAGTYGVCEACEREIPLARLRAAPGATRCVRCQEAADRTSVG